MKPIAIFAALGFVMAAGGCVGRQNAPAPAGSAANSTQAAGRSGAAPGLVVYCAAGLKPPVEKIVADYEKQYKVPVRLQYGGSGELLSSLAISKQADLFLAADASYITQGKEKGLIAERLAIARHKPVLAVKKGNPKKIASLADLNRQDVRFALANPETASIGRVTKKVLTTAGLWDSISKRVAVTKPTVTEVANDVQVGAVDAAVVWDATVAQFQDLQAVPTKELAPESEDVVAGVVASTKQPTAALRFARYLAAPDRGGAYFKPAGYAVADGDPWQEKPEFTLYSGSVNRVAIEKLLQQFEAREGARINTVYNGCGILCATMRTLATTKGAKVPDAYYACDLCFVPPVADLYPEAVMLTEARIGIAVPKGNPKKIKTLLDLAQPGMKLGIANARQASLGFITEQLLKKAGLYKSVMENAKSQVPTGDLLANQVALGSLDAAIVYYTNVKPQSDKLEIVEIKNNPWAKAVQPFSVAAKSPHRQIASRLLTFLQANHSAFEAAGFRWRQRQEPLPSKTIPQTNVIARLRIVDQN